MHPTAGPLLLALALAAAQPARAEVEIGLYAGAQEASGGTVDLDEPGGAGRLSLDVDWEGRSFEAPPHYGLRATWWRAPLWGVGAEFDHQKLYASDATLRETGFERLEFTDGHNLLTAHVMRRFPTGGRLTPYLGAGVGVALPWVEVQTGPGRPPTDDLRWGGPAVVGFAGAAFALGGRWSVFGEAKASHAWIDAELDGGGTIETAVSTGALNLGLSLRF